MREKRLRGEADDASTTAFEALIEQLPELCQGYEPQNIQNLDKLELFSMALPEIGLTEKKKENKGREKSIQRMTVMFIVAGDGSFVFEPIVIWRSKLPRCFRSLKDLSRPMSVYYFSNRKAWPNGDVMETVLGKLDHRTNFENLKAIFFLDNATCNPKSIKNGLTNIKLVLLHKNSTLQLQPLDVGIIRNFKLTYRKLVSSFCY